MARTGIALPLSQVAVRTVVNRDVVLSLVLNQVASKQWMLEPHTNSDRSNNYVLF